ncbi:hypothetical protein ACROYT_G033814 [Oculina patagonica]
MYFAGKKVVKKSLIPVVVGKTFDKAKSGGCKKLRNRAASSYAGVSEKNILQVTSSDLKYQVHNARFTNKAIPKPVTANHVQSQHQIDLVDLSKDPVRHNGKVYKYVLSVIDVFSRFLWLVPMESKSSSRVAKLLQQIYDKHGPPDRLQSDRGPEFEGQLRSLCKQFKIKMIKSRPYHPQSQGKVERSHRRLRKKIMYDFINLGKKGVNWASNLDAYNRILNEESKEELGWKSPFEVYFGRKSNILVKESLDEAEVDMDNCIVKTPKRKDYNRHFGNVKKLRKRALRYSRRMNERMVKRYARLCKTPAYKRGDEVLVRYRPDRRGNIPPKRRVVLKGTIVKKGKTNAMYKVRIVPPKSEKEIEKWVSIEDIANLQSETEKKKRVKQEKKRKLEELRKKLYIPMTQDDHLETFSAMGYSVVHNPRGDGNCQFEALRFWLQRLGFYRSEESIREEIVRYLTQNPFNADGIPLENFAAMPWDRYLTAMSQDGEYGDHLTLQAAADIFNIEIVVVSSLGPDATVVISPTSSIPVATIQLGHFAEGDGEHYVCVEGEEEQEDLEESREFSRQYESSNASVEQEQGQSVFNTDNNVQVRFVSDSMLVMNNLNDNNSNNSQEVTGITIHDVYYNSRQYTRGFSKIVNPCPAESNELPHMGNSK